MYAHDGKVSKHFATLRYDIDVREGGNALTVVATYPFGAALLSLSLVDQGTRALVATERSSSLRPKDDGTGEWGGELSHANVTAVSEDDDMATFLEVPGLAAGRYLLEVTLRRSLFLPTKKYPTCLSFGLALEYVKRTQSSGRPQDGDSPKYEVLAVLPAHRLGLDPKSEFVIGVHFDAPLELDDLVRSPVERLYVCGLVNTGAAAGDSKDEIHPRAVHLEGPGMLRLDFNFASAAIPEQRRCYSLRCSTARQGGEESINPLQVETKYCFETEAERKESVQARCNPHARPKRGRNGECICAAPYTGRDCEECQQGFKAHE